jgi:hypothetical protein
MCRNKRPGYEQPVNIIWHTTPPSPVQLAAWRRLWARLLGPVNRGPETPQPQDLANPGAAGTMTVSGGHDLLGEHDDSITQDPDNQ